MRMDTATKLRKFVRLAPGYKWLNGYRQAQQYQAWIRAGKPVPPPHRAKQQIIATLAKQFDLRVFVETGTYLGDMIYAVEDLFDRIISIELDGDLSTYAQRRFARSEHVTIIHGDSGEILGPLLRHLDCACLFWLDGHYSGGITARGGADTPIETELLQISQYRLRRQCVLCIDDARCFNGVGGYPSIESLRDWALDEGFDHFLVQDDVIRIFNLSRSGLELATG